MIDVPVLVKEALREGNTRKNYRFDVYKSVETDAYSDLGTISETEVAFVINEELPKSDVYLFIYNNGFYGSVNYVAAGGGSSAFYIPEDPTSEIRKISLSRLGLGNFSLGDTITLYGTMTPDSVVDVKYKTGTTTEEVFDFVIDNNNLVKESVRIDERMCSDTNLKFGLCEGTQLEFQCFGVENITGRRLKAYVEVNYINENDVDSWHPVTLGWFTVKECSRQASTGILKVSCYNKLLSDYLDAKANSLIEETQGDSVGGDITIQSLQSLLLADYEIEQAEEKTLVGGIGTQAQYLRDDFTFKVNGSNLTYYPWIEAQLFTFWHINVNERHKLEFDSYLRKLKQVIASLKQQIYNSVQNPDTVWQKLMNSYIYQAECGIGCSFGDVDIENGSFVLNADEITPYQADRTIGDIEKLKYLYGVRNISFMFPVEFGGSTSKIQYEDFRVVWDTSERATLSDMTVSAIQTDDIESITLDKADISDVTLRDLVSANYELHCQYGKLDRETDLFSGVELNNNRLLPADTLYPADDLYPNSMSERANRAMYSKLWADEGNVRSFRYLIITYKGTEVDPDTGTVSEVEKKLQRTVNTHGTDDYNMSDNWLFKNLVWTDEDVGNYADAMVEKMRNITWFPFEMWCAGLPYIETGDEVEISVGQNTYTSYVLRRNLKGIQNLQDEMINGTLDIF